MSSIKTLIDAYIKRNANQEITGPVLNGVLTAIADALGTPFIGEDGYWYEYDQETGEYVSSGTPAQGESGVNDAWAAVGVSPDPQPLPSVDVNYNPTLRQLSFTFYDIQGPKGDQGTPGITGASVSVDANVGTPSVDASIVNSILTLAFHNLRGAAAGFGTPTISVGANQGTPSASVTASGPDTAKVFAFAFDGLKGETGPQGPQGPQGNTGANVDYPYELVNNLETNDPTKGLSAAMGVQLEGEVSQLSQEVGDSTPNPQRQDFPATSWTSGKFIYSNTGLEGNISSNVGDCTAIDVSAAAGKTLHYYRLTLPNESGTVGMAFYDSSNNYISGQEALYGAASLGMTDGEVLVPSNAKYARFTCVTASTGNFYAYIEIPDFIYTSGLGKRVQDLDEHFGTSINDFEIVDGDDNAILKLKNGGIKTRNFDSEKLPEITDSLADYEIADGDGNVLMRIRRGQIVTGKFDSEKVSDNPMAGKSIVWYGTSIPAAGYPEICGKYLNATVHNEAVGGSMCRMGMPYATPDNPLGDVYGIVGLGYTVVCTSLTMSQQEKHDIFVNWTTARRQANLISQGYTAEQVANVKGWGELLTGNPPADIMDGGWNNYRKLAYSLSYNTYTDIEAGLGLILGKVDKYLNEDTFPDLWVFDHGHNDNKDNTAEEMETIPTPFDDRHYFIGAVNFLINHILQYNPRARFMIVGHYDDDEVGLVHNKRVCVAQEKLADFWNAPIYKTWEMSSITRERVVTTNAYWDTDGVWHESGFDGTNGYTGTHYDGVPENIRQVDGVWVHDMSLLWVHMLDGLHPAQDEIKEFLGHSMAKYISSLVVNF